MHDIRTIRENPGTFDAEMERRGIAPVAADILSHDQKHRALLTHAQDLQAERNTIAKEIGRRKAAGDEADALVARANVIKDTLPAIQQESEKQAAVLHDMLARLPNVLSDTVPAGNSDTDNVCIRTWGEPKKFTFTPRSHVVLGEASGAIDFSSARAMSGARFVILRGDLALLERALINFMIDHHIYEYGYTEISPPYLVRPEALFGTGQLPKFADDQFLTTTGHYLIPTGEVPLTNLLRDQIVDESTLPQRYVAHTPCFRQEAGSAGKDTHGMIRQHQFHKVELVSLVTPEESINEHERMTQSAETLLQQLGLSYRVMILCAGDTGGTAHKTYDLEVWLPSENRYREISSCSICTDYQARRMNARYKTFEGKNAFVHTLNGSGLAVGRTLVAILENFQDEEGNIHLPEILHPYTRKPILYAKKNHADR
ncbi:MAG: serine--tRNA ligase [Alphaproteobacteria bacterium]|nr:MAG: serine--tRNA ligase [Alphaproteobacteria bacterium]